MKTSKYIRIKIDKLPKGYVFTYSDFINDVNEREAIIKSLNRMAASGKIAKLSKGKYYKPEESIFGTLYPQQYQIVKDLIEKNGKLVGYLTGYSTYNQLGLTTQVSNLIQIGKREVRPALTRGIYRVSFISQKNTITKDNVPLLQILDAIRFIKKIPDSTIESSCMILCGILKKLNENEVNTLIKLAAKYAPSTRALLGGLLESINTKADLLPLSKSLNPITRYKLNISESTLSTINNWNIQ